MILSLGKNVIVSFKKDITLSAWELHHDLKLR